MYFCKENGNITNGSERSSSGSLNKNIGTKKRRISK
jgi:hypothetical protein